ncbi:2-oxo acid dehydrogenase subunit E2 [Snodgrassella sp. CFCC 13594]|uniref:2-oxo acid dehydrogenase subunit E2 n=1 Tax=Snodgrassella sp. CFCC 13594 TaxID=1775559 RepID=UPI000836B94E|nr:2-oxo acid dehydrogenase subunit E2 [Snodgrassella sp. CFCC 13594]
MAETVLMPKLGLTMTEGVVDEWYKKEGDAVQAGEAVCSISSEKLTQDVEAEQDGILLKIVVQAGESTPVKTPIGYIGQAGESVGEGDAVATPTAESTQPAASAPVAAAPSQPIAKSGARVFISKLARKIASAQGIDYTNITGTGGNGRITKRDVEKYMASGAVVAAAPAEAPTDVSPIQAAATVGAGLNGMRKAIAKNMMYSLHNTAQLTLHRKADITALLAFRAEMKSKVGDGVEAATFSLNILLLKAVALALQACPKLNSRYDGVTLSQPDDINIGVAVALENGLVVPTVADVGRKSLSQLQKDFYGQVARAATVRWIPVQQVPLRSPIWGRKVLSTSHRL